MPAIEPTSSVASTAKRVRVELEQPVAAQADALGGGDHQGLAPAVVSEELRLLPGRDEPAGDHGRADLGIEAEARGLVEGEAGDVPVRCRWSGATAPRRGGRPGHGPSPGSARRCPRPPRGRSARTRPGSTARRWSAAASARRDGRACSRSRPGRPRADRPAPCRPRGRSPRPGAGSRRSPGAGWGSRRRNRRWRCRRSRRTGRYTGTPGRGSRSRRRSDPRRSPPPGCRHKGAGSARP